MTGCMENTAVVGFHDAPNVRLELGYQFRHTIMRFGPRDCPDFGSGLWQIFFDHNIHNQFVVYEQAQQLKRIPFLSAHIVASHTVHNIGESAQIA